MKTAMQQAIEKLQENQKHVQLANSIATGAFKRETAIEIGILSQIILELTSLLPTEQEQMKMAHDKGAENMFDSGNFEQYYTETFKNDKDV